MFTKRKPAPIDSNERGISDTQSIEVEEEGEEDLFAK